MVSNLGKVSGADLENVFAGHVAEGAVWCSDRDRSYPGFAERHGLDLIQIKSDGPRTRGIYAPTKARHPEPPGPPAPAGRIAVPPRRCPGENHAAPSPFRGLFSSWSTLSPRPAGR